MNRRLYKILFINLFLVVITLLPTTSLASSSSTTSSCTKGSCKYYMLAPISSFEGVGSDGIIDISTSSVCTYLANLYKFGIYIAIGLAVIMIVIGGMQYVSSDSIYNTDNGRKRITAALQGLILALMAYLILKVVNPQLVACNIELKQDVNLTESLPESKSSIGTQSDSPRTFSTGDFATGGNSDASVTNRSVANGGTLNSNQFPDQSWNDYMLDQIHSSGLMDLNPADAAKYFPDGKITEDGYLSLFASMAKTESNFNPSVSPYYEKNGQISLGLFGFSTNDNVSKKYGYTTQSSIEDPYHSMDLAVSTMKSQIQSTGSIQGNKDNHYWGPLYRNEVFKK